MIDDILQNLSVFMIAGIIIVLGISQFNRTIGSALGILFWSSLAIIGSHAYEKGGSIGLPGSIRFSRFAFLALCGVFVCMNIGLGYRELKRKRMVKMRQQYATAAADDHEPESKG